MGFWTSRDDDREGGGQITFLIGIILAILAPISATLVQLAISRKREYLADASGALMTRYPEGLASALEKISADNSQTRLRNRATAHLFIANPFKGESVSALLSTHPPIADRVKKLREMGN
jgi:heat shock protein HtpX